MGWLAREIASSLSRSSARRSVGPSVQGRQVIRKERRREVERNKKKMKGEWGANTKGAERRPDEVSISDPGMLWSDDGICRKNPPLMRQIAGDI